MYSNALKIIIFEFFSRQHETNLSCELCGKNFAQNGALKAHISYVHEGLKKGARNKYGKNKNDLKTLVF